MSEFDQYARSYRDVINQHAAITGETFEYFIDLRLRLLVNALAGPAPRNVLDFGCGSGGTEQAMGKLWPQADIDGIDPSPESIEAARKLDLPRTWFHVSVGTELPFADASYDVIYSNGTFHHIEHSDHPAILREIARVLRPGGHAFIFENNPYNPLMVREMRHAPIDANAKMLFPHYLARLQRRAGLRVNATRFYVFYPKQLKFLRWSERYLMRVPIGAQYFVWGTKPLAGEVRRHGS